MNAGIIFRRAAKRFSNQVAIKDGEIRMTYADLYERSIKLANGLSRLGVKKGDRVACLMPNCHEAVEFIMACYIAGFIRVQLGFRLAIPEILQMIDDAEATTLIMDPSYLALVEDVLPTLSSVKHFILLSGEKEGYLDYEDLIAHGSPEEHDVTIMPEDIASLNYTSGTSGVLKAAMLTHRNFLSAMRQYMLCEGFNHVGDIRVCYVAPITHAAGLGLLPTLYLGGLNVLLKQFDVKLLLDTLAAEKITNIMLVPTIINLIMDHPDIRKYDLSSLRGLYYGASPMSPTRVKQALDIFGPVLLQGFGQTESTGVISLLDRYDHVTAQKPALEHRFASAGMPSMECEVCIVDEKGKAVEPEEIGEIIVRGDNVMKGYWKNPELTAETIKNGWLYTRDMGKFDNQGYLYLIDRKSDMIVSGGFNIYPAEVEKALEAHSAVFESAVVGVPDEQWGEAVKALVVLQPGSSATEQELIDHCKRALASFKKPKSIEFVNELPKSFVGKILRRIIKEKYWENRERKIN
ncbi:MAG: long-chain fatty acid--CoA ligase [Desulfobacterales bacterium]